MNVSGKKKQETSVNWRTLSFCVAAMVLKISEVRCSAERIDILVELDSIMMWSRTSCKYTLVIGEICKLCSGCLTESSR